MSRTDPDFPAKGASSYRLIRDDFAYILPIAVFLLFTWAGGNWPEWYPTSYVLKTVIVAGLLIWLWPNFTKIRWNHWWLGIIIGVVGLVQWVGMEMVMQWLTGVDEHGHARYQFGRGGAPFLPHEHFDTAAAMWSFILIRWAGASLLVPVMEELFWRDFLWRSIVAPNDFKMVPVGEWDWRAFAIVAGVFGAAVHIEWLTAIVYGLLIGWLLLYTRSLGACIIAHGVTNFLLGLYVLVWQDWRFW
jgi:uncharacterized protein